jgi:phage terminase large subunit-like protein
VLRALETVRDLASRYAVQEVIADPWRWGQAALELEREGVCAVQFPQTDVRMVPASQRLRDAILEQRLVLPDDRRLAQHAANAVQRSGRRGTRAPRRRNDHARVTRPCRLWLLALGA